MTSEAPPTRRSKPIVLLLLAVSIAGAVLLWATRPQASKAPPRTAAPQVEVQTASVADHAPLVHGFGRIDAAQTVALAAEVSGRVRWLSDAFVPGTKVPAHTVLARIDDREFRAIVTERTAQVEKARLELELEKSRGAVAEAEWTELSRRLESPPTDEERALALRTPQRRKAEADLGAAEAALERARLDVARCVLRAPFDAVIQTRDVHLGSFVNKGMVVTKLLGQRAVWVSGAVALDRFRRFIGQTDAVRGARVYPSRTDDRVIPAKFRGLLGDVTETGGMARVLLEVDFSEQHDARSALLVGDAVRFALEAPAVPSVPIPESLVQTAPALWILQSDDTIRRQSVTVGWRDEGRAYVIEGLTTGQRFVLSPIYRGADGMKVRVPTPPTTPPRPDGDALSRAPAKPGEKADRP